MRDALPFLAVVGSFLAVGALVICLVASPGSLGPVGPHGGIGLEVVTTSP
jgi:hypothetical protein